MYRFIEPEVAGGFGNQTEIDSSVYPPIVKKLHYEFNGWLEDDILETFPCFIVTQSLKKGIEVDRLTGIVFDNVLVSKSREFSEVYVGVLPEFFWVKIKGEFGKDDFFIGNDSRLIISERAFQLFKLFKVSHAVFEEVEIV